jgi:very-short-patch-repair endonuclease
VDEGTLQALIYMGAEEHAFRAKPGLRPEVFHVVRVGDAGCEPALMPARVFHALQVAGIGDRGLAQVAAAQRGLVHRTQVQELGISRGSFSHRLAAGSLHRVLPSVLAVVDPLLEPLAAETAALLYAGDGAVLSHESAAALWGLTASPSFVALTVIDRHVRIRPQLEIHRAKTLDIRDVSLRHGLPVTAPARTLIDCATSPAIDRLLNEARALKLVSDTAIREAIARCPGRPGTGPMRRLLEAEQAPGYTRSEAERRLKRIIKDSNIETPIFNQPLLGYKPDALWRRQRVIVEVDGYRFHGHRQAFERDRARDAHFAAAGYVVLRFTWRQVTQRPFEVATTIAQTLGRREAEMG